MKNNKNREHLSRAGIGPVYVSCISIMTLLFLVVGGSRFKSIPLPVSFCVAAGVILFIFGVFIYIQVLAKSHLHKNIMENHLITEGVFSYVRNPIYSAFMFAEWGILLIYSNPLILAAVPLYWILMTVLLKHTEEKWLRDLYGRQYELYCSRVNRCIPWFRRDSLEKQD